MRLKRTITVGVSLSLLLQSSLIHSNNIDVPDIGTSGITTLSIGQEMDMGDYYMRQLRGSAPLINDPMLSQYLNDLGQQLVARADSVKTPFHFYILKSNVLNAFAFFGGNVVIHSRLLLDTDNESQLAGVISHEIGHVTQRHLARAMEKQNQNSPYVFGAALGSILLALASPEAGMAAMASTLAGSSQSAISFSQKNEQEADRIGLKTLNKAGFDPYALLDFLQKLADQVRFSNKPPEILLTHPLPASRLSDTRNQTLQYRKKEVAPSLPYYLAKVRLLTLIEKNKNAAQNYINELKKLNNEQSNVAVIYAQALSAYRDEQYQDAKQTLAPLLAKQPNNIWFIDLMTDIDLELHHYTQAIGRLQTALTKNSNNANLQLNLANAYIKNRNFQEAVGLLHRYTYANKEDINGWDLLISAYDGQHLRGRAMSARAEILALQGQFPQAIQLLRNAIKQSGDNEFVVSRMEARISQIEKMQSSTAGYLR